MAGGLPLVTRRLVLFDLDGVVVDSRRNMEDAWAAVRAEFGVTVPYEAYMAEIGRPFPDIMQRLGLDDVAEQAESIYRERSAADLALAPIYDGMIPLLLALRRAGTLLGIVTSKDRGRLDLVLERLPRVFAITRCPDAVCRGKPAPDHLLMAMGLSRCDPAETCFVGDMASDAEAARRAHVDFIHAGWGYGADPPAGCIMARDPAELAQLLVGAPLEIPA
jgi:phosphoglycolate phosphatase